uniref:Immunoglobulin V-set domain-containing protein n=1 Tax=Mastacembelus armatus TaxID=205130 RepID=A0A3Q3RUT4_9TELE
MFHLLLNFFTVNVENLLQGLIFTVLWVCHQNVYQAEENHNITIGWDVQTTMDLSAAFLECVSGALKTVYYMVKGSEVPGAQHQQFAGRVQCDRDALRKGRIRLHLSTVTAGDSGSYWCSLAVDYDNVKKQWAFEKQTALLTVPLSKHHNNVLHVGEISHRTDSDRN